MSPSRSRAARRRLSSFIGIVAFALASLLAPRPAAALDPTRALTQYLHEIWQTEQGLPQNNVTSILRARDGYLWMGTSAGLGRFDGVRFKVFDAQNTPLLSNSYVLALLEDGEGRLWIRTTSGLVRHDAGRFTRFSKEDGLPADQVDAWMLGRNGRLWVATLGGGIARFEGNRFVRVAGTEALSTVRVGSMIEDGGGGVLIGTRSGLFRLTEGVPTRLSPVDGLSTEHIRALQRSSDGSLWIGTALHGVIHVKDGKRTSITTRDGLSSDRVSKLLEDSHGTLWIGTDGNGLNRLVAGRLSRFTTREGLSNDNIMSLSEDGEGSLWIGTGGGGLNRLRDGRMTTLSTREGLSSDRVGPLFEDRDGALWIGTFAGGLNQLKDGRFTYLTRRDGLLSDDVVALWQSRDGTLWIATTQGLNRWKDGRMTSFGAREGLHDNHVSSLLEDETGALWIGTEAAGLSRLKDGRITTLTTRDGLAHNNVFVLGAGKEGRLWVGTLGGGISLVQNGKITSFTTKDGLASDFVVSLYEDREGTLWVGTQGAGLSRLKGGRLSTVSLQQGMFDSPVAVMEDEAGFFWISSNKGIMQVGRQELEAAMDGRTSRITARTYGTVDGMRSTDGGSGYQSGMRMRNGRLWFSTARGAVMVDPGKLAGHSVPPPVFIEEALIDGKATPDSGTLQVAAGTRAVELHYTGLGLLIPDRVRFKYRLVGYDPDWVDAGSRRTAYYTGVPHGEYRFQVIASSDGGSWNEEGASRLIIVERGWHETVWFRFVATLLVLLTLYGAYRVRVFSMKERERELVGLVERRTRSLQEAVAEAEAQRLGAEQANRAKTVFLARMSHELRTPLNAVLGFSRLMARRKRDDDDLEQLGIITRSGEHLLGLINSVLSLSKIEAGVSTLTPSSFEPVPIVHGLVQMLSGMAEAKGLKLDFEPEPGFPPVVMADEGKLRQILLNLMGNAVKFTERGRVSVRATWKDGQAAFEVHDTGPGLTPAELEMLFQPFVQTEAGTKSAEGTGLGLTISRGFARLMGGDITVRSAVGSGSVFTLSLPLPAAPHTTVVRGRGDRRVVVGIQGEWRPRILVVDDVLQNRLLLSKLLSAVGFVVMEAKDGQEALALWERDRPDLIFMDMRMMGMDGMTATRRIREREGAREQGPAVRIVALSASVLEHEQADVLAAGCDDFLPKPFREGALFEKVAQLLGIRFEYEGGASAAPSRLLTPAARDVLVPERVAQLSPASRERLRAAIKLGDDEAALAAVDELRDEDPELADALSAAVRAFQIDRLLTLMEQVPA